MGVTAILVEGSQRRLASARHKHKGNAARGSIANTRERGSQEELSFDHNHFWGSGRPCYAAPPQKQAEQGEDIDVTGDFERSHFGVVRGRNQMSMGTRVKEQVGVWRGVALDNSSDVTTRSKENTSAGAPRRYGLIGVVLLVRGVFRWDLLHRVCLWGG